jgi:predicted AlkP superfamily pyrophosphatase or phosphodiesterase
LFGNRHYENNVNCANPHWFSSPGYSELFTGFVDRRVKSNDKIINPNSTVLEFINQLPEYQGKVAAFSTWDVIPYIIRAEQAGIATNCGKRLAAGDSVTEAEAMLDQLQQVMNPAGERLDVFTFYYALEHLKKNQTRVLYIGLDETDQFGHAGRYDKYLLAAHQADRMIASLWRWIQSNETYKDKTTLLITTDHGRGKGYKSSWKSHGRLAFGSGAIWFAVLGPDTPPTGEVKSKAQYFQKQLAKTAAAFLGIDYYNNERVGEVVDSALYPKAEFISSK